MVPKLSTKAYDETDIQSMHEYINNSNSKFDTLQNIKAKPLPDYSSRFNDTPINNGSNQYHGKYSDVIHQSAQEFNVPANLIASVAAAESGLDNKKISMRGARGMMQLMPETSKQLASELNIDHSKMYLPENNIRIGSYYLSKLMKGYNNDVTMTLAGYNAGPGNVNKYGGIPPFEETRNYITKVKNYYNNFNDGNHEL